MPVAALRAAMDRALPGSQALTRSSRLVIRVELYPWVPARQGRHHRRGT